jgi:hypothetical protein
MKLILRGEALRVKWKASECLNSVKQSTAQGIAKDSSHFMGYEDMMDKMHKAGVTAIDGYHRGVSQVIYLDQECTGNPKTRHWNVLTDEVVHYKSREHTQFNSMCVMTLNVAKACRTLTSGPKLAGIAHFGLVGANNRGGGGGGGTGGGGGRGGGCPPPPKVEDDTSSSGSNELKDY